MVPSSSKRVRNRLYLALNKEHRDNDDVARCNRGSTTFERRRVCLPLGGGKTLKINAGKIANKTFFSALDSTIYMVIERDEDDVYLTGVDASVAEVCFRVI